MLLFFIRHGDPIYDPDSLTDLGKRQAEAAARRLALYGLDEIYVSSSARARQTAQPTLEILKMEATVLDWCNERHAWMYFAVPYNGHEKGRWAFHHEDYRALFRTKKIYALGEDWHTAEEFQNTDFTAGILHYRACVDDFMASLGYTHDREALGYRPSPGSARRVALFAHQGFGLAFLSCLMDIPYPMMTTSFDMGHTGITTIEFPEHGNIVYPTVLQLSNDSHLYRDGLPTDYQNRIRF